MTFNDLEVLSEVYAIHDAMDYQDPPFSCSAIMERLFPEIDVVARKMEEHAIIEVYRKPLPNKKQAVVAYNEEAHHSTQRFSISHELAHWIFDFRRGEAPLAPVSCANNGRRLFPERRADFFAAELLCPLWVLNQHVDFEIWPDKEDEDAVARRDQKVQRLASRFNLSMRCMRRRVGDLHAWRKIHR